MFPDLPDGSNTTSVAVIKERNARKDQRSPYHDNMSMNDLNVLTEAIISHIRPISLLLKYANAAG